MIKAIFTDINGVLFKEPERFSVRYSTKFNFPLDKMTPFFTHQMDLCLTGKADLKEELAKILPEWKWYGTVDELLAFWLDENESPYTKFIDYLNFLKTKGLKIYLTTQNERYRTQKYVKRLKGLLNYDKNCSTYIIGYKKSNPKYFETILNKEDLLPVEVLMIDNNQKAIESADSLGIKTYFYTDQESALKDVPLLVHV